MKTYKGWLFDLYPHPRQGLTLWLLGEDDQPYCFQQDFEMVFYARGPFARLRELSLFLRKKYASEIVQLGRHTKRDLFDGPQVVLEIRVATPKHYQQVQREVQKHFEDLIFYNIDVPLTVRYAATSGVFMLAFCEVKVDADHKVLDIRLRDSLADLDPPLPRLRILSLRPDQDPDHHPPEFLLITFKGSFLKLAFSQPAALLHALDAILRAYDPDVICTHFGDAWLFPRLQSMARAAGIRLTLNRDSTVPVVHRRAISFINYGQAHYRAAQTHLRGRWHVDARNGMTYLQYRLMGAIEQTRLSSLPLQEVTRRSPGAAIAAMQVLTAMQLDILVPYQRQKGELAKTYAQFARSARGGLIFQPTPGVFENVAVLDFSSKMASIMIHYNVSPETVVSIQDPRDGLELPELGVKILSTPGLVPQTLRLLRDKRLTLKRWSRQADMQQTLQQARRQRYKAISDALKWLTVVCYGRLGFANSIFGRLNAHEVVSYLSRRTITQAKEMAEAAGFEVLHLYVDSLFVSRPEARKTEFQALMETIQQQTGLPMDLENIYRRFAFLRSQQNPNLSVANRFYGLARNGNHKIRGIALRRHDTCAFIGQLQTGILEILAQDERLFNDLNRMLFEVQTLVQTQMERLYRHEVALDDLVIRQTLSRDLECYSVNSPPALVARQLQIHGRTPKMGQRMRFLYTRSAPGVHAWDLPVAPDLRLIDVQRYQALALRAVHEVLNPMGLTEALLRPWLFDGVGYLPTPDPLALPLFSSLDHLRLNAV